MRRASHARAGAGGASGAGVRREGDRGFGARVYGAVCALDGRAHAGFSRRVRVRCRRAGIERPAGSAATRDGPESAGGAARGSSQAAAGVAGRTSASAQSTADSASHILTACRRAASARNPTRAAGSSRARVHRGGTGIHRPPAAGLTARSGEVHDRSAENPRAVDGFVLRVRLIRARRQLPQAAGEREARMDRTHARRFAAFSGLGQDKVADLELLSRARARWA